MTTPQKFNVRVRRGFRHAINFILEDTDYQLLDYEAPWFRRLKQPAKGDLLAALKFMREQAAREIDHKLLTPAMSAALGDESRLSKPTPIIRSHGPGAALAKAQRGAATPGQVDEIPFEPGAPDHIGTKHLTREETRQHTADIARLRRGDALPADIPGQAALFDGAVRGTR